MVVNNIDLYREQALSIGREAFSTAWTVTLPNEFNLLKEYWIVPIDAKLGRVDTFSIFSEENV